MNRLSVNRLFFVSAFVLGLLSIVWIGAGFVGSSGLALAMTALIGGVYLMGAQEIRRYRQASAALSLFGLSYPATMQLQVEGVPYYDGHEKAIYLRSVKLLDSSIEASGYRGSLKPVTNELLQLVNGYLANNPVYRLDTANPTVKLLTSVPVNMAVQQGRISFMPGKN